jgi:hypothetical protein
MITNPDDILDLHSKIFSAGITDGFYFGGWDQYPKLAAGLAEIGATKSQDVIDQLLAWLRPHYEDGGIEAVWREIESNRTRSGALSDEYCATNEDVRELLNDLVELELSE